MRAEVVLIIIGMTLVTAIPRLIPAILIEKMHFGRRMEKFLKLIPYTAMAALIFPGVLSVDPDRISIGLTGAVIAAVLGLKKCPLMVCVLAAVIADILLYLF